jgi:hypothetical protein
VKHNFAIIVGDQKSMAHLEDYIGKKFRNFTVASFAGWRNQIQMWNCVCDCGNKLKLPGPDLHRGRPESCGCARDPNHDTFKKNALNRALKSIEKIQDCWIWKGLIRNNKHFHPYFKYNHRQYHPVRFFRLLINEQLLDNHCLKKTCCTPRCVNPEHWIQISITSLRYKNKHLKEK